MQQKCKRCIHRRSGDCNYIMDMGKPRGCSVQDCDKARNEGWILKGDEINGYSEKYVKVTAKGKVKVVNVKRRGIKTRKAA
mgnify:CR=1 FL=1